MPTTWRERVSNPQEKEVLAMNIQVAHAYLSPTFDEPGEEVERQGTLSDLEYLAEHRRTVWYARRRNCTATRLVRACKRSENCKRIVERAVGDFLLEVEF